MGKGGGASSESASWLMSTARSSLDGVLLPGVGAVKKLILLKFSQSKSEQGK